MASSDTSMTTTSNVRILSKNVDGQDRFDSQYRLLKGDTVKYLTIAKGTFDRSTRMNPVRALPQLPWDDKTWTVVKLSRNAAGELETEFRRTELAAVQNVWHPIVVDLNEMEPALSLSPTAWTFCISPALAGKLGLERQPPSDRPFKVIAKIARFEDEIQWMEKETLAYQRLEQLGLTDVGPRFLGHLSEGGRVMGILLENLDLTHFARSSDLEACKACLEKLHRHGIRHGDVNRYHFVDGPTTMKLVSFGTMEEGASAEDLAAEMKSLRRELKDMSGRGDRDYVPPPIPGTTWCRDAFVLRE